MKKIAKKILLISFHFPPSSAVGGLRIYGFANHLIDYGWKTYVLTIKEKYAQNIDISRYKINKEIKIFKTHILPKLSILILNVLKKLNFKKNKESCDNCDKDTIIEKTGLKVKEGAVQKIKRAIDSLLLLPDENRNWIIPAVNSACKEIESRNIKIVLTSCPPYSTHLIGLLLKYLYDIIWIADYRDPWIIPFNKYLYPTSKISLSIEKNIEKLVINKADIVTSTTEKLNRKFIEIYGGKNSEKFLCISNGFDGGNFKEIENLKKYEKFTITYIGTLYFGRSPEPIFKAIDVLKKEGLINGDDIRLNIFGNCQYINGTETVEYVKKYNLKEEVKINSPVSYREAIRIARKSHLGLVLAPKQPYQIPAKIYDMIGSETKVIAITEDGATKQMVEKLNIGKCFLDTDIKGIKKFIYQEFENKGKEKIEWKKFKYNYEQREITNILSLMISKHIDKHI